MADVNDKKTRSYNMSKIKGKDAKPEMLVRKFLHAQGFGYRLHDKTLPGKPYIVLPKYNTILQIHGCFWHGHEECKYPKIPETRIDWWKEKIEKTKLTDQKNSFKLKKLGWEVITIHTCKLKPAVQAHTLSNLLEELNKEK